MIGYPITYGDTLEEGNDFTSERVLTGISEYWSDEENVANFNQGYKLGLLVFGISGILLSSTIAFAGDSGVLPSNNGANSASSCPAGPGSLANVPTTDRGTFGARTLGICGIAMRSDAYAYWVGFLCAGAVLIGVRMSAVPANQAH